MRRRSDAAEFPLGPSLKSSDQILYLLADVRRAVNGRWWRWISVVWSPAFASIAGYRLSRAAYLGMGRWWPVVHTLLAPVRMLLRPLGGGLEIHYKADIGPGLLVLHPSLGVVISANATIGTDLVLTGGNCIGIRPGGDRSSFTVGNRVNLGANSVVLGPGLIGDDVVLGAGSVLLGDAPSGATMVGVPAAPVVRTPAPR